MIKLEKNEAPKANYKYWLITWNNPPMPWQEALQALGCGYVTGQLEMGKNGTLHIQALLYYPTSIRGSHFKDEPFWHKGISAEDAKFRVQAYVAKTETRVEGPYEWGTKPRQLSKSKDWESALLLAKQGKVNDIAPDILIPYLTNLKKIAAEAASPKETDSVRGLWIYGPPGTGKSHWAREEYPTSYIKPQNKWFDGYNNQESILLDDLDKNGACLSHYLKIWCDRYPCYGEIKGATIALQHDVFIITSNYLPEQLWPQSEDAEMVKAISRRFRFVVFYKYRSYLAGIDPGKIPIYNPYE